ncbi:hypothetical protein AURDEDRAFT_150207 [Auricularia subglabra TFB-10046 SS5]|nr:hypothetical protein AURDEDRAFT_150207 [Auricularia subglabra TFB-10046 SS5]
MPAQPLSEKAKGKQRAVEPEAAPREEDVTEAHRDVLVRFSEGAHDLLIPVTRADTVRDIKRQIRDQRPLLERRRLKLIHAGRLLVDGTHVLEYLQTLESRAASRTEHPGAEKDKGKDKRKPVWLQCSVGARLEPHEEDDGALHAGAPATVGRAPRGFDRLAAAGLTDTEIASLRAQFHSGPQGLSDMGSGGGTVLNEEELEDQARTLEERWIDTLDNGGDMSTAGSSSSVGATVVQGLLVGFFFPLLPFFFMREARPPAFWSDGRGTPRMGSVVFSRRMQVAVVMGFVLNLSFGVWRYLSS